MFFHQCRTWWHRTLDLLQWPRPAHRSRARIGFRPQLVLLEDRLVPITATHLVVTVVGGPPFTAGGTINFQVVALDALNNQDTTDNDPFAITSTSTNIFATTIGTLNGGAGVFSAQLTQSGPQTVTTTDNAVIPSIMGTSVGLTITAAPASAYRITATNTTPTSGVPDVLTITQVDQFQNVVSSFTGPKTLIFSGLGTAPNGTSVPTVSDMNAKAVNLGTGETLTFTAGVAKAGGTLVAFKAETATLAVTDGTLSTSTLGGAGATLIVSPAAATKLAFGQQPTNTAAGRLISPAVTVQVLDAVGNLVTSNTSNVTLAIGKNPGGGTLSGTATVAAVGGIATFGGLSINKAGIGYTLAAADGALTGATSTPFNIGAAAPAMLSVTGLAAVTAGAPFSVTVTAQDQFGNTVPTYVGTIQFTTNDPGPGVNTPANFTFATTNGGVHTFTNGVTLVTPGVRTVTASDSVLTAITGTLTLTVNTALNVGAPTVGTWTQFAPNFPGTLAITGGTAPYGIVSTTMLPPGLTPKMIGSTIVFTGTPTKAGLFDGTITIQDNAGAQKVAGAGITISPALAISNLTVTQWTQGVAGFNSAMTITGGTPQLALAGVPAGLPPGITAALVGSTFKLSGKPTSAGTFHGTVTIKDSGGAVLTKAFTIKINSPPTFVLPALPPFFFRSPYSEVITTTGGTGALTVTYSVSGVLPVNLTVSPASPTASAITFFSCNVASMSNATITMTVTDALGAKTTKVYTLIGAMPGAGRNGW